MSGLAEGLHVSVVGWMGHGYLLANSVAGKPVPLMTNRTWGTLTRWES